jgi:hypothetical protein
MSSNYDKLIDQIIDGLLDDHINSLRDRLFVNENQYAKDSAKFSNAILEKFNKENPKEKIIYTKDDLNFIDTVLKIYNERYHQEFENIKKNRQMKGREFKRYTDVDYTQCARDSCNGRTIYNMKELALDSVINHLFTNKQIISDYLEATENAQQNIAEQYKKIQQSTKTPEQLKNQQDNQDKAELVAARNMAIAECNKKWVGKATCIKDVDNTFGSQTGGSINYEQKYKKYKMKYINFKKH